MVHLMNGPADAGAMHHEVVQEKPQIQGQERYYAIAQLPAKVHLQVGAFAKHVHQGGNDRSLNA